MTGDTDLREVNSSVVVVGNFNPLIFQPEWLRAQEIIGKKEAETARETGIEVIHPQLVILNLSSLRLEVQLNRFILIVREPPVVVTRDFALKCLKLLSHTPVTQVGLNFGTLFRPRSRAAWDAFGDALAPKGPWKPLLGEVGKVRTGGLTNIRMERAIRPDKYKGQQAIHISISNRATMDTLIDFNDHYEISQDIPGKSMELLVEILSERWDSAEKEATEISNSLRSLCHVN